MTEYNEKLCEEKHKNLDKRLDVVDKRLDAHADKIDSVEKANIKLTEILDIMINPDLKPVKEKKESFWNTKTGQLVPWLGFAVIVIIIVALVGTNLIEGYQAVQGNLPKVK